MKSNLITFILGALVVLLILKNCSDSHKYKGKEKENLSIINALNDSLKIIKHRDSSSTARIGVLQTQEASDFIQLQIKNNEIKELQSEVKKYKSKLKPGSSVTIGNISTKDTLKNSNPPSIVKTDTVRGKDSLVYLYPTYRDSIDNGFTKVVGTMGKDSSEFAVSMSNDFSAIIGYDKRKPFIDFNLKHPNSTITKLRSYQVSVPKPKRWGFGIMGGYGFTHELKRAGFIGAGVQYNLIRF
jgi:hypothetical protein